MRPPTSVVSVLRVTPDAPVPRRAVEVLRGGGVIVFPTDTVYGLGCDATDVAAVRRVFAIKGRAPDQPVPVLLADSADAEQLAFVTPTARRLIERFWPGPLTIVMRSRDRLPDVVTAGTGTVGLRVPDHVVPRTLARELGRPLVGTSANVHGQPPATSVVQVLSQLDGRPDLVLDGGRGKMAASTVVDCTADVPRVLRPGPISEAEILAAAG